MDHVPEKSPMVQQLAEVLSVVAYWRMNGDYL